MSALPTDVQVSLLDHCIGSGGNFLSRTWAEVRRTLELHGEGARSSLKPGQMKAARHRRERSDLPWFAVGGVDFSMKKSLCRYSDRCTEPAAAMQGLPAGRRGHLRPSNKGRTGPAPRPLFLIRLQKRIRPLCPWHTCVQRLFPV